MRLFLTLIIVGLGLMLLGFAIMFGSMREGMSDTIALVGLAMILIGMLVVVTGFVVNALRRPTRKELASQKADVYGTWHFRPVGLLISAIALFGLLALANWAEQLFFPGVKLGRRSVAGYIVLLICLALLSIRKVRDLVFYTGQMGEWRETDVAAEPAATADQPRDRP